MKITDELKSKAASAARPVGLELSSFPNLFAAPDKLIAALPEYMIDAVQRSLLSLDLLRRRGNEEIEITSRPMATVLRLTMTC